jgi:hypothetical protein
MVESEAQERERLRRALAAEGFSLGLTLSSMATTLQASEYLLIQVMQANDIWTGSSPKNPGGTGELEWSLIPYWIHNPPSFVQSFLDSGTTVEKDVKNLLWSALKVAVPTQMDTTNYNALIAAVKAGGLVGDDGTLIGDGTYEVLDPGWLWAVLNYLLSTYTGDIQPFNTNPPTVPLSDGGTGSLTIALVGDWGTGAFTNGQAIDVMQQIGALAPNYLIHMGDVYYSGTGGDFLPLNEEQNLFLNNLPAMAKGTCFALNSNHEMYAGGKGYFTVALADSRFSAQQNNSYFALTYGGWTILGLDSAYNATSMYMNGALDTGNAQANWITNTVQPTPSATIVLTHHNPINYDGSASTGVPLWDQVAGALGGTSPADPAAWYWGHIHNGIVYNPSGITARSTKTLGRCLGHGALPFGNATGLQGIPTTDIPYYAQTANTANPPTVLNGFVLLTITSKGEVTEEFFENGNTTAKYTNTYKT